MISKETNDLEINSKTNEFYNIEISGAFHKTTVNYGMSMEQTKTIVHELFENNFPKLRLIAEEEATKNMLRFGDKLAERLQIYTKDNSRIVSSPDFQFTLSKAIETAARFDNPDLHDFLVKLLSEKIECKNNDSKSLILSECINAIGKLSLNQLNILTFSFMLLEYPHKLTFETWDMYNVYFEENVRPFMGFENNQIDFKHLEFVGCTRFDPGFGDPRLSTILKTQVPHLFQGTSDLSKDVSSSDKIVKVNFDNCDEIEKIILDANIWGLNTTSVGIMLSSIFYEKITMKKLSKLELFFDGVKKENKL